MNYAELLEILKTMKPDQLADPVYIYSGDIDDTIAVIGTAENNEYMGEPLPNFRTTQVFLVLE
jgi:hypothetical protein